MCAFLPLDTGMRACKPVAMCVECADQILSLAATVFYGKYFKTCWIRVDFLINTPVRNADVCSRLLLFGIRWLSMEAGNLP